MVTDQNTIIGERIRFYRTARHISLERIGKMLTPQMTLQMLSKYETGQSRWPADLVMQISTVLGIDVRRLFEANPSDAMSDGEWQAERYKNIILGLQPRVRDYCYSAIDLITTL